MVVVGVVATLRDETSCAVMEPADSRAAIKTVEGWTVMKAVESPAVVDELSCGCLVWR
jgi:hypothetical protein